MALTDETVTRDDLSTPNVVETTPVMEFEYTLRDDGLRDDVTETRYSSDGSSIFSQTFIDYGYDADGRLTDESLTVLQAGGNAPTPYADHYTFDLSGNRRQKVIDAGNNGTTDETITYSCNERDQLITEDSTIDANDVTYRYDPNGSMTEKVTGAAGSTTTTRYLWDLRNRMVAVDGNGDDLTIDSEGRTTGTVNDTSDATYSYDTNGVRISETPVGGTTTYYLIDPQNPTGYAKQIEEKQGSSPATATLSRSYVLGLKVEGQSDEASLSDGGGEQGLVRPLYDSRATFGGPAYPVCIQGRPFNTTAPSWRFQSRIAVNT